MKLPAVLLAAHLFAIAAPPMFKLPMWVTLLLIGFFWMGYFGCNLTERK